MMKRNTIITVCAAAVLCIGMALCLQGCRSKATDTVLPEAKSAVIVAAEKQPVELERPQEQKSEAAPELAAESKAQVDKTDVVEPKEDQQKQALRTRRTGERPQNRPLSLPRPYRRL